jgi:hypothetical protein
MALLDMHYLSMDENKRIKGLPMSGSRLDSALLDAALRLFTCFTDALPSIVCWRVCPSGLWFVDALDGASASRRLSNFNPH